MQDVDISDLKRISELIYLKYNYDFRDYAMSSFKRRVVRIMELNKLSVETLLKKLTEKPVFINEFVDELTVNVTEMFRDPGFWRVIRDNVFPTIKRAEKKIKIWHAGCSSGEEVLTMCILLHQIEMLQHVSITATDLDANMLQKAKTGTYATKNMEVNEKNYTAYQAGTLKNYYEEKNGNAVFNPELLANVSFEKHDLVLGPVLGEYDLIFCRNVMIYFNQALQNQVLRKFHESLSLFGHLCIGSKESLIWCDYANRFTVVNQEEKIYKKIKE
jgi:chemotaxis protein methyltransferase CheR